MWFIINVILAIVAVWNVWYTYKHQSELRDGTIYKRWFISFCLFTSAFISSFVLWGYNYAS